MIEFRNVSIKFKDKLIFDNFNLSVEQGEKVLLFGKSGTGKSSFLKLVLGFLRADSGEIYVNNNPLDKKNVWQLRKQTAYVSQNLEIGEGSIRQYFKDFLCLRSNTGICYKEDEIIEKLRFLELPEDILDKNIEEISGGEKQRIAIVTAILLEREIYLLDEITSALDTEMKRKVANFFVNEFNKTLLLVSHDEIWTEFPDVKIVNINGVKV
jgi:putative ABC transport system ATP-binding protein